jgi:hypothetical protein
MIKYVMSDNCDKGIVIEYALLELLALDKKVILCSSASNLASASCTAINIDKISDVGRP